MTLKVMLQYTNILKYSQKPIISKMFFSTKGIYFSASGFVDYFNNNNMFTFFLSFRSFIQ